MKATTRLYAWRRFLYAASAKFLAAGLFVFFSLSANAQRDIFHWEFSGSFAGINSGDFELPEEPSLFAAGGRLQRNLGNAWQVGLQVGHFNFGESPHLERTYAGLSAAYFWDNGVLLKKRAFITPYHLVDVGVFGRADVEGASVMEQSSAAGVENGLKFRFGDRITFHVAYAVYRELDSRGFEETFGNSGLSLWKAGLSYHFGAKRVNYNGPVFDASARFDKPRFASSAIRPLLSLPGLEPDEADVVRPDELRIEEPKLPEPLMITGVDTIINFYIDTAFVTRLDTTIRTVIDTNYATSVDTAFVFRVDSVRGSVLDTNFTNVVDTVFTERADTAFAVRMDTMFTVRPDTVFRQWSRPEEGAYPRDREDQERVREDEFEPLRAGKDSLIVELTKRILYLEGFVEGISRNDTVIVGRRERVEKTDRDEETRVTEQREEPTRLYREEKTQAPAPEKADEEKSRERRSGPAEAKTDGDSEQTERPAAEPQKTDPAVLAIMERQEELMKTQNALLRELTGKSSEVNVEAAARERRLGVGVAPALAVPVGGRDRADKERIEKLEEEVAMLRSRLDSKTAPQDTARVTAARIDTRADVADPVTNGRLGSDSLAPDTAAAEQPLRTAEEVKRDSMKAAVDAIRQRADSISAANAERAARREAEEKSAAAEPVTEAAPEPAPATPKLSASYPAVFKFGLNRDDVGADYNEIFDKVAADLINNPEARARIVGFTDRSGNAEYNRQLSERRAQSIKRRLTDRGVPAERLVIRGEGEKAGADKWSPGDRKVEVTVTF